MCYKTSHATKQNSCQWNRVWQRHRMRRHWVAVAPRLFLSCRTHFIFGENCAQFNTLCSMNAFYIFPFSRNSGVKLDFWSPIISVVENLRYLWKNCNFLLTLPLLAVGAPFTSAMGNVDAYFVFFCVFLFSSEEQTETDRQTWQTKEQARRPHNEQNAADHVIIWRHNVTQCLHFYRSQARSSVGHSLPG